MSAEIEEARSYRIFSDHVGVAEYTRRNVGGDRGPSRSEVIGLVDVRPRVAQLMKVDRQIRAADFMARGFDVGDRAQGRQILESRGDVGPRVPAVSRYMHQSIVGARPDHALLQRGFGNREEHRRVRRAHVVRGEPAGLL